MSKYLRIGALAAGIIISILSILIIVSGQSLLMLLERGTLLDQSGLTPVSQSVRTIANTRIAYGVIGCVIGALALALIWIPKTRVLLWAAAAIAIGCAISMTVTTVNGSLADTNTAVLVILIVSLLVLMALVVIVFRGRRREQR